MTPAGTLTVLHAFTSLEGTGPVAALIQGADGHFYGTTPNGGTGLNVQLTPPTTAPGIDPKPPSTARAAVIG